MSVSFDAYKVFYYVAKHKNITNAASALYLTQPTVSHTVAGLEKALGCQLFIRSKKGVQLTPEAELLYDYIEKACQNIWEAEHVLNHHLSMTDGLVRIGASETTLHHFLLPYLRAFKDRYPRIRLRISNTTTPAAVSSLKKGLIDFAVIISPEPEEGLSIRPVASLEDVFIAGESFSQLKGTELHIRDLSDYPLICLEKGTSTRECLERFFEERQCQLVPDIELATTDLITPMVAHNLGIGFVPLAFARQALEDGLVFRLSVRDAPPKRSVCLVTDAGRPLSVAGNRLIQMIQNGDA